MPNTPDYRVFETQMGLFGVAVASEAAETMREVALDVLSRLVLRTPVDTGRARGGWLVGIDRAPDGEPGEYDKSGVSTIDRGKKVLSKLKGKFTWRNLLLGKPSTVEIVNNVPYMKYLEDGRSQQAPSGIVGITMAEY